MAAYTICESVLLALIEQGVLDPETVTEALEDAAEAHRQQAKNVASPDRHVDAADLIEETVKTLLAAEKEA